MVIDVVWSLVGAAVIVRVFALLTVRAHMRKAWCRPCRQELDPPRPANRNLPRGIRRAGRPSLPCRWMRERRPAETLPACGPSRCPSGGSAYGRQRDPDSVPRSHHRDGGSRLLTRADRCVGSPRAADRAQMGPGNSGPEQLRGPSRQADRRLFRCELRRLYRHDVRFTTTLASRSCLSAPYPPSRSCTSSRDLWPCSRCEHHRTPVIRKTRAYRGDQTTPHARRRPNDQLPHDKGVRTAPGDRSAVTQHRHTLPVLGFAADMPR